jgi:hypothetical protein
MNLSITKLTITPTIALSSFSFRVSRQSILPIRCGKGIPHFVALGPLYFVSGIIFFAGLVTAAVTRNEWFHQFYAVVFLIQTAVISFAVFRTLI